MLRVVSGTQELLNEYLLSYLFLLSCAEFHIRYPWYPEVSSQHKRIIVSLIAQMKREKLGEFQQFAQGTHQLNKRARTWSQLFLNPKSCALTVIVLRAKLTHLPVQEASPRGCLMDTSYPTSPQPTSLYSLLSLLPPRAHCLYK